MEDLSTPTTPTPTLKETVRQLREQGLSMRDISKRCGVTKYRVETIIKELEAERPQAQIQPEKVDVRTGEGRDAQPGQPRSQPRSDTGQPNEIFGQPSENLGQPMPKRESATDPDMHFLLDASEKNTQKAPSLPRNAFNADVYIYMSHYKRLMKQMHLSIKQRRCHWRFYIEGTLLKGVQKLQKRGQCLAQEQGLVYDELLLCGVLEACHDYLLLVLRIAPVVHTWMTMRSMNFLPNKALLDLLQEAQQAKFDAVEPKQGSAAA